MGKRGQRFGGRLARLVAVGTIAAAGLGVGVGTASAGTSPPSASRNPATDINRLNQFDVASMLDRVNQATKAVEQKLEQLKNRGENISIADMFEMQLMMNKLAQLSEMSTSVVSASNSAIASMARNVKS